MRFPLGELVGDRRIRRLWLAQSVSVFGDMLTFLAVPMLVYETTGSKAALSLTIFIGGLPGILAGPVAGALVDRWDRRRVMVLADLGRALVTAGVLLVPAGWTVGAIYAMVGAKAVIGSLFLPAMRSVIPAVAGPGRLVSVNSFLSLTLRVLQVLAPLIGAAAVKLIGIRGLLLIDIGSFVVSAGLIARTDLPAHPPGRDRPLTWGSLWSDMVEGAHYIRRSPVLVIVFVTGLITQLGQGFISPAWLPYVVEVLDRPAAMFGLIVSVQGLGCVVGSVALLALGVRRASATRRLYMFLLVGTGVTISLQATTTVFPVFLVWAGLAGLFIASRGIAEDSLTQQVTRPAVMGRVTATLAIIRRSALLAGVGLVGLAAGAISTRQLFLMACGTWLAGCLTGAVLLAMPGRDRRARAEPD